MIGLLRISPLFECYIKKNHLVEIKHGEPEFGSKFWKEYEYGVCVLSIYFYFWAASRGGVLLETLSKHYQFKSIMTNIHGFADVVYYIPMALCLFNCMPTK